MMAAALLMLLGMARGEGDTGAFEEAWSAWERGVCSSHNSCATCIKDTACGWCTGSIGNSNPGSCVARTGKCDTILETAKCPDCHLPWIRFANAVPSSNTLDCKITQGSTTKTWSSYKFAQFSDWSQTFKVGPSKIEISSAGKTLLTVTMPLTPGPLVVVVKDDWPPTKQSAIETIAASYNPVPKGQAGVRLFNLSPDKASQGIGMRTGSKTQADQIRYSLGSQWMPVGAAEVVQNFTIFDDSQGYIGSLDYSPPRGASTIWVLGDRGTPNGAPLTLVPKIDAPQVCGGSPDTPTNYACNSSSFACEQSTSGTYKTSTACAMACKAPPPPPPPAPPPPPPPPPSPSLKQYTCGFNSTCVLKNPNSTGPVYNTSDCNNNCTIYTPKCQCTGTAAKPGHCIAATYNVSIQPCSSDPAKQQWTYESDTQHFRLTSSGSPGLCMIACGISWADHPDIKVATCDVNDPRQQFGQVHHQGIFSPGSPAGCGPGQTHECWHWETMAFIGNCIDGEGCGLDNGDLQSYPCAYEGGCDHIYSNQMWELDKSGYLRDAQKCINGSTSCELFYCATATPLANPGE